MSVCFIPSGTELVGPSYRKAAGFGNTYFYAFGQMALAGLAYGLRDWRHLELAITLPMILFFSYWWCVLQSYGFPDPIHACDSWKGMAFFAIYQ